MRYKVEESLLEIELYLFLGMGKQGYHHEPVQSHRNVTTKKKKFVKEVRNIWQVKCFYCCKNIDEIFLISGGTHHHSRSQLLHSGWSFGTKL